MTLAPWAIPNLTTEALWNRESIRRELKLMSPEEVLAHADSLVVRYADMESILRATVQRCACLELELMLKGVKKKQPEEGVTNNPVNDEHREWSSEVTQQLATLAQMRAALEPPSA